MSYRILNKNKNTILNILPALLQTDTSISSKDIEIPTLGYDAVNYVMRLALHYGVQEGDELFDELFMNGACANDFSDIRFEDENGNILEHYIHFTGNYDFIKDSGSFPKNDQPVLKFSDNTLITDNDLAIVKSTDNGANWTVVYSGLDLKFVDSNDNIYGFDQSAYKLYKLSPSDGYTAPVEVMDMSALSYGGVGPVACGVRRASMAEDSIGNIFLGTYQSAYFAAIYKSSDGGDSFSIVWFNEENQHIHFIGIDPYTGYVYAGIDASRTLKKNIRSVDSGTNWTVLDVPYFNRDYGLTYYGNGFRLGNGEAANSGGITVWKTTDDVNFTKSLNTMQGVRQIADFNGSIVVGGNASRVVRTSQLVISEDNADNWITAWADRFTDTPGAGDGPRWFTPYFTPQGASEQQMICTGQYTWTSHPENEFKPIRMFKGGSRYFALIYVKVGNLPIAGKTIKLNYGYNTDYPKRKIYKELIPVTDLLFRIKLNEGSGLSVKEQISGENIILPTNTMWSGVETVRYGHVYPYIRPSYSNGIKLMNGEKITASAFKLPDRNFTIAFWANLGQSTITAVEMHWFIGQSDRLRMLKIGINMRIYPQGSGYYLNVPIFSIPVETDSWNFYVITVSNDALPVVKSYVNEFQTSNAQVTEWNLPDSNLDTYIGGHDSYDSADFEFTDIMVFNRELTEKEQRDMYFGYEYI